MFQWLDGTFKNRRSKKYFSRISRELVEDALSTSSIIKNNSNRTLDGIGHIDIPIWFWIYFLVWSAVVIEKEGSSSEW